MFMNDGTWLYRDHEMQPGAELFRSDRRFWMEAYSAGHSQLLLRSVDGNDGLGRNHETTVEILFKPVDALSSPRKSPTAGSRPCRSPCDRVFGGLEGRDARPRCLRRSGGGGACHEGVFLGGGYEFYRGARAEVLAEDGGGRVGEGGGEGGHDLGGVGAVEGGGADAHDQ